MSGAGEIVVRSLPLQAVFNPQTLQGAGFAFALLPVLRRVHGPRAASRAAELSAGFNANPYVATYAIGAAAAAEGREPPERIDRFLALTRGPLGALGDALFWSTARPAILVPPALAVAAGAPWWLALAALVPYNALAFAARFEGARTGLAAGLEVGSSLGRSWIRRAPVPMRVGGAFVIGALAGWLVTQPYGVAAASMAEPGGLAGAHELGDWIRVALIAFALSLAIFALWPRRLGWGVGLVVLWGLWAGLPSWLPGGGRHAW